MPLYDNQGKQLDKYLSDEQKIILDKETNPDKFGPRRINTPPAVLKLYRLSVQTDLFVMVILRLLQDSCYLFIVFLHKYML